MKGTKTKKLTLIMIAVVVVTISFFVVKEVVADNDADGIIDLFDNCLNEQNTAQYDFDSDNQGDVCDYDDDNDGILDNIDAFPLNANEWDDFDLDGIGANEDTDDDNDGISDTNDPTPVLASRNLAEKYQNSMEKCAIIDSGFPRQLCYTDFFELLVKKGENSAEVSDFAFRLSKLDTINDCHFLSHRIGMVTYEENPSLSNIMVVDGSKCRNGFAHGTLSAFFLDLKENGEDFSNWHMKACDDFIEVKEEWMACLHGVGHGVFFYYEDLKQSLAVCNTLTEFYPLHSCLNGLLMQYTDDELTKSMSIEHIQNICSKTELEPLEYEKCTYQLGISLVYHTDYYFMTKSIELCETIKDEEGKMSCNRGATAEFAESHEVLKGIMKD